jgi:hypothetical protein
VKSYEISALLASAIITLGLFWYIGLVLMGRIRTVVASWIVSTVALTLSLVTYSSSPRANWFGASLNIASALSVAITLAVVYLRAIHNGEKVVFTSFQKTCLKASALITLMWIVIVWGFRGTGIVPNLLTQALIIISYSMLIVRFWKADRNTESLLTWWCILVSSVIGLYTAWTKVDWLAFIYALRSTVMCGILIFALHRIGWRNRNLQSKLGF